MYCRLDATELYDWIIIICSLSPKASNHSVTHTSKHSAAVFFPSKIFLFIYFPFAKGKPGRVRERDIKILFLRTTKTVSPSLKLGSAFCDGTQSRTPDASGPDVISTWAIWPLARQPISHPGWTPPLHPHWSPFQCEQPLQVPAEFHQRMPQHSSCFPNIRQRG